MRVQQDSVVFHCEERQVWHLNGKLHRVGGPAMIESDGTQYWHQNGDPHRLGGPAIIYSDGYEFWFKDGEEVTQAEVEG